MAVRMLIHNAIVVTMDDPLGDFRCVVTASPVSGQKSL